MHSCFKLKCAEKVECLQLEIAMLILQEKDTMESMHRNRTQVYNETLCGRVSTEN